MNRTLDNFYSVLRYSNRHHSRFMPESAVLAMNESIDPFEIIDTLNESLNEDYEMLVEAIGEPTKVKEGRGTGLKITIDGKEYRYVSPDIPIEKLYNSVHGMWKHHAGFKIVQYLRKNALCYYGAKKPSQEGRDLVGFMPTRGDAQNESYRRGGSRRIKINGKLYEAVNSKSFSRLNRKLNESKWHDMTRKETYGMNYWNLPDGSAPKRYAKKLGDGNTVDVVLSGNEGGKGFKVLLSAFDEVTDEEFEWGVVLHYNEDSDTAWDIFEEVADEVSDLRADSIEEAAGELEAIADDNGMDNLM